MKDKTTIQDIRYLINNIISINNDSYLSIKSSDNNIVSDIKNIQNQLLDINRCIKLDKYNKTLVKKRDILIRKLKSYSYTH
jgi:hypothetical protein